jgi:hypothetical protein
MIEKKEFFIVLVLVIFYIFHYLSLRFEPVSKNSNFVSINNKTILNFETTKNKKRLPDAIIIG